MLLLTAGSGACALNVARSVQASDAVWRATRPLHVSAVGVVPLQSAPQPRRRISVPAGSETPQAQRTDRLRQLRVDLNVARAGVRYFESRMNSYRRFRYSDGMLKPIAQTELALEVARQTVTLIEAELRRASRPF
ncbi:hypothetical protein GC176_17190 [bacterium]|nr:hypothetical protein [bacterium]